METNKHKINKHSAMVCLHGYVLIGWWTMPLLLSEVQHPMGNELIAKNSPSSSDESSLCSSLNLAQGEIACNCRGESCTEIPSTLDPRMTSLSVIDSWVQNITKNSLEPYRETLKNININKAKKLVFIEDGSFNGLKSLTKIVINHAPLLTTIPENIFAIFLPNLKVLKISNTALQEVPKLNNLATMKIMDIIDFTGNKIKRLPTKAIKVKVTRLILENNDIEEIQEYAFSGSEIKKLNLRRNRRLKKLHEKALANLTSLRELDLSSTSLEKLPTVGIDKLEKFRLEDTTSLKVFPTIYAFKQINKLWLTYSYHCCAFHFPERHDPDQFIAHQKFIARMEKECSSILIPTASSSAHATGTNNDLQGFAIESSSSRWIRSLDQERRSRWGSFDHFRNFKDGISLNDPFGTIHPVNGSPPPSPSSSALTNLGTFHTTDITIHGNTSHVIFCGNLSKNYEQVLCYPTPDAFNPCEDIMGNKGLRIVVWFVVVAAVTGNLAVMIVLLSSQLKSVSKFLMCNLAFADFCMGIYLAIIASMDLHSVGEYFNYAIDWQEGYGCQIAGFLTVFASELSIFTLTVITVERWFAITFAIHLHKRLELNMAAKVMVFGWVYAIVLAILPLVGISGYSKTSICLPMETRRPADLAYLAVLLVVNGLAFILICICYKKMYWSIRNHNCADRSSDINVAKRVAKRMALLVFTDFACWAPIAFFGLTAIAGYPLIGVTHAKFLLVFFYPLNSCANPFLYAILTKHYRRDFYILLGRLGICKRKAAKFKTFSTNQRTTESTGAAANRRKNSADHTPRDTPPTPVRGDMEAGLNDGITIRRLSTVREHSPISEGEEWEHSSTHKGSPHPVRNSSTKQIPSPEQEELLQRALEYDKRVPNHTASELIPLAANGMPRINQSPQKADTGV